jgi:hypothetical protein
VVVDVALALVLALRILVRLMVVPNRRMVVLVIVSRLEVGPVLAVRLVVDDVVMGVTVDRRGMIVLLGHTPPPSLVPSKSYSTRPAGATWG